jgi:hypothetical protein
LRRKEVGNDWLRKGARFGLLLASLLGTVVNSYSMRKERCGMFSSIMLASGKYLNGWDLD